MNNNGQIAQTVANTLTENKGVKSIQFAITGDIHADLIAGFKAVIMQSADPGELLQLRHVQFALEYCLNVIKDSADRHEKLALQEREKAREWKEFQKLRNPSVWETTSPSGTDPMRSYGNLPPELQAIWDERLKARDALGELDGLALNAKTALQNEFDNACNGLHDAPVKKNTP